MATVSDACTQALQRIGVLAAEETASSADLSTAFGVLNQLMDSWGAERLTIPFVQRTTFTIVSGTATYAIGTNAAINVMRPVSIDRVNFIDSVPNPDLEMPLNLLTNDAWQSISMKSLTSAYPVDAFYNPVYGSGQDLEGTITLYPVPTATTLTGVVYAPLAISQFSATSTTVNLPPGYQRFLVTNLALELAPLFGAAPSPDLREQANESKATIKRANITMRDLTIDSGALPQSGVWTRTRFLSGP